MFHKVMVGEDCFGRGTQAECEGIVRMHRQSKDGYKKETKASTLDFKIVSAEGEYPDPQWRMFPLGYKPGTSAALK